MQHKRRQAQASAWFVASRDGAKCAGLRYSSTLRKGTLMKRVAMAGVASVALTLFTTVAGGQAIGSGGGSMSNIRGASIGASFTGASVSTSEGGTTTTESGTGFQIEGLYGLNRRVAIGLDYARANIEALEGFGQYTLSHIGGIGRLFFRDDDKRARPYLEGAILRREIGVGFTDGFDEATVKTSSIGGGLGGGVQIFASPKFAFDISGQYAFGSFGDWEANGQSIPFVDISATSFTLRLGGRFYIR